MIPANKDIKCKHHSFQVKCAVCGLVLDHTAHTHANINVDKSDPNVVAISTIPEKSQNTSEITQNPLTQQSMFNRFDPIGNNSSTDTTQIKTDMQYIKSKLEEILSRLQEKGNKNESSV